MHAYKIDYRDFIERQCTQSKIPLSLACAVIKAESKWKPDAVSAKGAVGLMQLLPSTAVWLAEVSGESVTRESLFNPEINISLGIRYLEYLDAKYAGDTRRVLAAYNAGEGNVDNWINQGTEIQFEETVNYLKRVRRNIKIYEILL